MGGVLHSIACRCCTNDMRTELVALMTGGFTLAAGLDGVALNEPARLSI